MAIHKRDNSLDFIKGVATMSVVLLHNLPHYYVFSFAWIGQAVQLFLFITAYLTYISFESGKTLENYYSKKSTIKMLNRIFKPFIVISILQCIIYYYLKDDFNFGSVIRGGGIGPGSYYPWLYLQVWLFLPFIIQITYNLSLKKSFLIFLFISVFIEISSNLINVADPIYRLLFYRYFFLLYLACITKKYKIKISRIVIILAIISFIYMFIEKYTKFNLEPIFRSGRGWDGHVWIGYFYTVFVFLVLKKMFNKEYFKESLLSKFFILLGKYSYEIFLCQMFVFSMYQFNFFLTTNNKYVNYLIFILVTTILSIAPVLIYKIYVKEPLGNIIKNIRIKNIML